MTAVPAPFASAGAEVRAPAPITSAGVATHAAGWIPPRLSADSLRPYIGILGVLIGALLSTIGSRITTFGLADLRGGLHFGFDEGAWMTTSFGVGQMLVAIACPYLGAIFSVRRILLHGMALLFVASLLGPLSPNLTAFLTAQFLAGVGSGTFIPLTIGFIVRNVPQRLVLYGLAVYAMNSELSQNVSASLEGWYTDNLSWRWIEWQNCVALPLMFACIWYGAPREKINIALLRHLDWPGLIYAGFGFALLYAGLDQGNRLDWNNNGLVNGLLLSGGLLTLAFVVRELWIEKPFLNLRLLAKEGLVPILLLLARLSLHHSLDRLYHPDLPSGRAELSGAAGRRCALMDRAAPAWRSSFRSAGFFPVSMRVGCLGSARSWSESPRSWEPASRTTGPPTISCPHRSCRRSANPSH